MDTDQPSAADAATTADVRPHWIGRRFSLSQRERAGVRESASNGWGLSQFQSDFDQQRFLPHPLSLSRWERETAGERLLKSLSSLREVGSLYYGFPTGFSIHLPGEPWIFCNCLVSVSIRVHPWLNCGFQVEIVSDERVHLAACVELPVMCELTEVHKQVNQC
jgi:hypothetical protein